VSNADVEQRSCWAFALIPAAWKRSYPNCSRDKATLKLESDIDSNKDSNVL
jgi:hypothetical protein